MSEAEGAPSPSTGEFRWQAFFQRTDEPLFFLSNRRRILFVNRAWEALTGLPAAAARGLACTRSRPAEPGPAEDILGHALCPPPEVVQGRPGRARRLVPGADRARRWWDVEFFPLRDGGRLLGVLGKITPVAVEEPDTPPPLPERLVALREGVARHYSLDQLDANLPAMRRVADQARLASQTCAPVLLVGERGTGKHWLARTIHHQGVTRERAFAGLECARLPVAALEAALFGEVGLVRRPGIGTVYLREPSRLPRELQARLAELLRESVTTGTPGPRLVAGCAVDPAAEVAAGRLLEDFHCALATLVIHLPALRDRQADLPWLAKRLLERANALDGRAVVGLTREAWDLVRPYGWPGNLGELYAVLVAARTRATGERIEATDLPASLVQVVRLEQTPGPEAERAVPLDQLLEQVERRLIVLALRRAKGNKSRAAELLGVWRPRLLRRMEALAIPE